MSKALCFGSPVLTCPPEHGVVEERELHLSVMLQRGPAPRCRHVDVGHVERHLHRQEGLSRVPDLREQQRTALMMNLSGLLEAQTLIGYNIACGCVL